MGSEGVGGEEHEHTVDLPAERMGEGFQLSRCIEAQG